MTMQSSCERASPRFALLFVCGLAAGCQAAGPLEYRPGQAEARNMRLLGHHDLQARSAYQPVIHRQGGRWIAYVGHHGGVATNPLTGRQELNGTSILDVTDPKNPKYLHHIPGAKPAGAQMVRVCDGRTLPKGDPDKVYMLRSLGNIAHEVWDVTTPEKPVKVSTVADKLKGTHKNWWECDTGIAYLVSGVPGWRSTRMTQVFDLSDPAKPVLIRTWGVPGQEPGAAGDPPPFSLHGPISTGSKGNRVYFGYGTVSNGLIQIVDRDKLLNGPKEPTPQHLAYPVVAQVQTPPYMGAHTTLPVLGIEVPALAKYGKGPKHRDILVVVNESTSNECNEPRQMVYFVDITHERTPFAISNFDVPEQPHGFCSRGGRFGAHASNEHFPPMYAKRIVFFSWFNAGVRAVDIRDPYNPREIAYFIPAVTEKTDKRCVKTAEGERCKVAIQTNNVEVDDRGYIYIVDRANTGMHILELTGEARALAGLR
ncbi:MAG: hypothetical protein K6U88_14710 [Dehalococcoidia bacterium]|nr:hypothetical protein [Dehalococcoidia bacterium]